jgi:hypothetical protein
VEPGQFAFLLRVIFICEMGTVSAEQAKFGLRKRSRL